MDVDVPFSFLTFLDNHGDLWYPYLILCTWDHCIHDDWEVRSCTTWPPEGARGYRLVRVFTLQVFHRLIWDQISPSTEHLLHDKDHSLSLRWKDVKFPWYTLGRQMYPFFVLNAISWQCFPSYLQTKCLLYLVDFFHLNGQKASNSFCLILKFIMHYELLLHSPTPTS